MNDMRVADLSEPKQSVGRLMCEINSKGSKMEKGTVTGSCRKNTTQAGSRSRGIKCDKELKKVKHHQVSDGKCHCIGIRGES